MLYNGGGAERDTAIAVQYFTKSAELGNAHAQYMFGKLYLKDGNVDTVRLALQWLQRVADKGSVPAQYALGKCYRDGTHVA